METGKLIDLLAREPTPVRRVGCGGGSRSPCWWGGIGALLMMLAYLGYVPTCRKPRARRCSG
jgi:hypothetical protein